MSNTNKTKTSVEKTTESSNSAEFERVFSDISVISPDEFTAKYVPSIVLIAEAEVLYCTALKDRKVLVESGLSSETIDKLKDAAGALRFVVAEESKIASNETGWREKVDEARELHDNVLHYLHFALRNNSELLSRLREISGGKSNQHLVQQLANFCAFGKEHVEELKQVGFDVSLLDKAAESSARLGDILGTAKAEKGNDVRKIHNQAYTYLKTLMKEVRDHGKFVFRKDKQNRRCYTSEYYRKQRRKINGNRVTPEAAEQCEAA